MLPVCAYGERRLGNGDEEQFLWVLRKVGTDPIVFRQRLPD
jgi:hypothetical protein